MLRLQLLYCLSLLVVILLADQAPESCHPYRLCSRDFQGIVESVDTGDINDTEIAKTGRMSGLKPESYELLMHFENTTQYTGSINITLKVIRETNRFVVHMDKEFVKYYISKTAIHHDCSHFYSSVNCFERIGYDNEKRLLIFWLKHRVPVGLRLTLELQEFTGYVYNQSLGVGSIGLNRVSRDNVEALHTNFLTKLASTVFPCFDHPSLKVKIQLCLQFPKNYRVASTAQLSGRPTFIGSDHRRQCFEQTPVISVYVFAFAVMRNYAEYIQIGSVETSVFVPMSTPENFFTLKQKLRDALRTLREITRTELPFRRISVLLLYMDETPNTVVVADRGSLSVENAGLISLYVHRSTDQQWEELHGGSFYRAVAHQWIGAGFTVGHWGEICLQQGLAQYMEWILLQHLEQKSIHSVVADIPRQIRNEQQPPMSRLLANYAADHNPGCEHRAALIFHMVAEAYGVDVVKDYVANLSITFTGGNVNMDVWDKIMAELTDAAIMRGYIKSWFTHSTPITLGIRSTDYAIVIDQIGNFTDWSPPRPIPMNVYTSIPHWSSFKVFNTRITQLPLSEKPKWIIVDPNNALLAVKEYSYDLYRDALAAIPHVNDDQIRSLWNTNYLNSFCDSILSNRLPLPWEQSVSKWKEVFQQAYNLTTSCDCCLIPASSRPHPLCSTEMGTRCDKIELVKMLDYHATVGETDFVQINP